MNLRDKLRPQLVHARAREHPVGPPREVAAHVGEHDLVGVDQFDPVFQRDQMVDRLRTLAGGQAWDADENGSR